MDSHHHEPVRAEPDFIPVSSVLVGVAIIIASFLVGIFWAYKMQRRSEVALGTTWEDKPAPAKHAFQYEVGIINQEQFESEKRAYTLQTQQRHSLNEYGWADRKTNLAYVPVKEGIKRVTSQYGGK